MRVKILLRELRTSRKLSQNKLAQRVEMTLQNLQRIEYGDAKSIPLDTLAKLCQALDCTPGDLLVLIPDAGDQKSSLEKEEEENLKLKQVGQATENTHSPKRKLTSSFLTVVPEVPESA